MAKSDLTGQVIGKWTVLREAEPGKANRTRWLCRCVCGKERVVDDYNLRGGLSTSCGCAKKTRRIDLTGQRFGRLTVLEFVRTSEKGHSLIWRCKCDCGNVVEVAGNNLRNGHTTSCGCALAEAQQAPEIRIAALKKSPLTGAFETNIRAKWYAISNGKREWKIKNLSKFVRDNAEMLGVNPDDTVELERTAKALYNAYYSNCRWHGWSVALIEDPTPPPAEEPPAEPEAVKLTPEIIKELEPDLLSVIKRCPDCGKLFVRKTRNAIFCRDCAARRKKESQKKSYYEHYYADIEASRAERREKYAKNREANLAYQAAWYAEHKDELKERRKAKAQNKPPNKEAEKAYQAEYYAQNRERIMAQRKAKKERDAAEKK